jgi:hypothetical protein
MGELVFKKFMLAVEAFLVNRGFIKIREKVFDDGQIIVVFFHNKLKCNARMYILDSNTRKRLRTFIYLTRGIKKTVDIVNENITTAIIKHGERI